MSKVKRIWQTFLDFTIPASRAAFSVLLSTITYLTATLGAVGLAITLTNPVNLWWSITPIRTPFGVIGYTFALEYFEFVD